jgi:MFS family permease
MEVSVRSGEGASTSGSPLRTLHNPNFRRLWVGSVASAAGTAVGSIILTWLVYDVTHSPLAISALGIVQFLPTLAFGLIAGALIDRLDRRRLMVTCDVARALCFGGLATYVLFYGVSTAVLIGVVFAVATFSTVFRPATNAAIPRIVPSTDLSDANGLLQGGTTIAQFVGSPVGSLFIVTIGATVGFALNALTFAISGAMIFLMVIPSGSGSVSGTASTRRSLLGDVGDGLRYLRSQRALLIITGTAMVANFFLTIWGGFTVIYAAEHLHQGATGFAILVAATTAGFAIGAILPGRFHSDRRPGMWLLPTWGIVGFFIVGLAWTTSLAVAVALTVVGGVLLSMGNTIWLSGVQRAVPDEYLGRYFAMDEAGSFAMIPAGLAVGGVLTLAFGITWAFVIAGVGTLVANVPLALSTSVRTWGQRPAPD